VISAAFYLFDLDGTLVDSSPVHERAYRQVLADRHPDLLAGFDYKAVSGLTTLDAFRQLGLDDSRSREATVAKQGLYRAAVNAGAVRALPGSGALLENIKARGAAIAIVTSASRASATRTLESTGLLAFADALITADDVTRGKPDPEPYRTALARLNADPARTIAVEDALSGIASAHAAGVKVIGVHDPAIRAQADVYFDDLATFAGALA
jgi:HAD superfamily hydrolase (TIGR01509 family)